ncbi:hypothetical protein [Myxococcus fulvus]|uniref:hypothetical protein n=1 Tax=Myxococcus fulvus TaxID=33 RepID=UPI0020C0C34E|nr:hypothetical protein [Myxococcus fulvus]MCK8496228.1 hypothetical protein [Myxococcus fulvus]
MQRLKELNARALRLSDQPIQPGQSHFDDAEATLGNAWTATMYDVAGEEMPEIVFGSYVLYYFATKQVFPDANKRTGWYAFLDVLATIDVTVDATDDEAAKFVMDIANKVISDVEGIVGWVMPRLMELKPAPAAVTAGATKLQSV